MAVKKVRQMRGPGMNKGLKKPRHAKFYTPSKEDEKKTRASAKDTLPSSYLSDTVVPNSGKRLVAKGGKVISSTTF